MINENTDMKIGLGELCMTNKFNIAKQRKQKKQSQRIYS